MNYAACVMLFNNNGEVLGVARKNDPSKFGLPGGKVEPHETFVQAAARECKEETGLDLKNLKMIFAEEDYDGYYCVCFTADIEQNAVINPRPGEAEVRWIPRQTLLDGPFGDYTQKVFEIIDQEKV